MRLRHCGSCRRLLWLLCLLLVLGPLLPGPGSRRRRCSAGEGPGRPGGDGDGLLPARGLTLAMGAANVDHQPPAAVSYLHYHAAAAAAAGGGGGDDDEIFSDNEIPDVDGSPTVTVSQIHSTIYIRPCP